MDDGKPFGWDFCSTRREDHSHAARLAGQAAATLEGINQEGRSWSRHPDDVRDLKKRWAEYHWLRAGAEDAAFEDEAREVHLQWLLGRGRSR